MDNKYCINCSTALMQTMRACHNCGGKEFSPVMVQPQKPPHPTSMITAAQSSFKNPEDLTKWTISFLYATLIYSIIASAFAFAYEGVTTNSSTVNLDLVDSIYLGLWIICAILILIWIYRANYNARQLGGAGMVFTPGWSIGWYFVPVFAFWKPYQAMKEIWKVSTNPQSWQSQSTPSLMGWWWFLWLTQCVMSNFLLRATTDGSDEASQGILALILLVTRIPLNLIFISIISKIHAMQMAHAKNNNLI